MADAKIIPGIRYRKTEIMLEDKLKKCIRNVQWISASKMRQRRECMIYRNSTFSGRAIHLSKCKCRQQCWIIRNFEFSDDL